MGSPQPAGFVTVACTFWLASTFSVTWVGLKNTLKLPAAGPPPGPPGSTSPPGVGKGEMVMSSAL